LVPFASLSEPLLGFFFFTQKLTDVCAEADSVTIAKQSAKTAQADSATNVPRR
jgi:hypothetical protein